MNRRRPVCIHVLGLVARLLVACLRAALGWKMFVFLSTPHGIDGMETVARATNQYLCSSLNMGYRSPLPHYDETSMRGREACIRRLAFFLGFCASHSNGGATVWGGGGPLA